MKIKELSLRSFKKFANHRTFRFHDNGIINDITLIVGENGCGKSSVLQAIAMLLGAAVKPHFRPSDLEYPGFNYDYIRSGRLPVDVRAIIQFTKEEIEATIEFSKELDMLYPEKQFFEPSDDPEISIWLDYEENAVRSSTAANLFQMKGYQYALQLRSTPNFTSMVSRVGSIYIYHEQRSSTSITLDQNGNENGATKIDEKKLRSLLVKWHRFHAYYGDRLREGQRDFYAELEGKYSQIFRTRSFAGATPKMAPNQLLEEEDFWLSEGNQQYELSEMSGGERAIFPLLIDFANWSINNSIILIDEIELHLHPPLQQALVRALPLLGSNNQFIITSHSDDVAFLVPESQIIRL